MTKIKNLEMAATISNNNDITINTSFFGLCEKATYVPTGSRVKAQTFGIHLSMANASVYCSTVIPTKSTASSTAE